MFKFQNSKLKSPSPCSRIPQLFSFSFATGQPALPPLSQKIHNDLRHQWETKISNNISFLFSPESPLITSFFKSLRTFKFPVLPMECEDYSVEDSLSTRLNLKYSYFPSLCSWVYPYKISCWRSIETLPWYSSSLCLILENFLFGHLRQVRNSVYECTPSELLLYLESNRLLTTDLVPCPSQQFDKLLFLCFHILQH